MAESREPAPRAAGPGRSGGIPIGQTIAVAIALAILVGLGSWQLQRLKWKEGLLARIAALEHAPARPLEPALDALARGRDVNFTRVSVSCPGLASARFVELYGLKDGQAGWRLISACEAASDRYRTILVDRGFVPDSVSARPKVDPADQAPVAVTGILRAPDKPSFVAPANQPGAGRWFTRDIAGMARALGAPAPAPVFLFAETSSSPGFPALQPAPLPTSIPNRHLEYALTWFGLAAALVGVYAAGLLQRRKK
jgi:surfeit locus 1 family protein